VEFYAPAIAVILVAWNVERGDMQIMTARITKRCVGKVRFRVILRPPIDSVLPLPHPARESGAPGGRCGDIPVTGFFLDRGEPGTYQSSAEGRRQFCPPAAAIWSR